MTMPSRENGETKDNTPTDIAAPTNFIRNIIDEDLQSAKHKAIVTRFPPEPNGYLHIGHAKSICLNFGLARDFGGPCHLRFDDTNPVKEETEYVETIKESVRWLGFSWGEHLYYASDYFEQLYQWAEALIEQGLAYVDDLAAEDIRQYRGTLTEPGKESPYRNRSVAENLDLFRAPTSRTRPGARSARSRATRCPAGRSSCPKAARRDSPRDATSAKCCRRRACIASVAPPSTCRCSAVTAIPRRRRWSAGAPTAPSRRRLADATSQRSSPCDLGDNLRRPAKAGNLETLGEAEHRPHRHHCRACAWSSDRVGQELL